MNVTVFQPEHLEAAAGLVAACYTALRRQVPVMVSVTVETTGTLLTGSDIATVVAALEHVVREARDRQPGKPRHFCSEIGV